MSAWDLGCVKTPASNLRVEIPSFRQFENQKCLRPLLGEDDRENNSAHLRLGLVFTQPGSFATGRSPLSFTGNVQLERFVNGELVEDVSDRGILEMMYFGHMYR
jgi:hypothetical protein